MFEESGLTAESMSQRGVIMFEFDGDPQLWEVHVFSVDSYGGTPTESDGECIFISISRLKRFASPLYVPLHTYIYSSSYN